MKLPFVSRGHHESLVAELRKQLDEKETERKLLWDFVTGRMGYGSMFSKPEEVPVEEETDDKELQPEPRQMRASQIVRHQNRLLRNKSLARTSPSRAAEVLAELDQAKAEGLNQL